MLNATAQQSLAVPNIQDWLGAQQTRENMEYDNFLSPQSIHDLRKSGGASENKLIIEALSKRKVWMGRRLKSPPSVIIKKPKIEKQKN